jgi:CRP/FNR family cyclic AMP-dependent transcriptional regulator
VGSSSTARIRRRTFPGCERIHTRTASRIAALTTDSKLLYSRASLQGGIDACNLAVIGGEVSGAATLVRIPLFAGLPPAELESLSSCLRRRRYTKGEVIFLQGDPGTSLYAIEGGRVKIAVASPEGKEFVLNLLGPGDFFGELALLDAEPRSADAVAQDPCLLLLLQREDFLRFLEAHPRASATLLAVLSRLLRRNAQIVQDAAFLDVPTRLARTILELGETKGQAAEGGLVVGSRLTQSDLAAMVGTTRESVNKWLRSYQRQGLIRYDRGIITVLRPRDLQDRIR